MPQDERSKALDSIDHQSQRTMTNTEKKFRKLRAGTIEHSPELSELGLRWDF